MTSVHVPSADSPVAGSSGGAVYATTPLAGHPGVGEVSRTSSSWRSIRPGSSTSKRIRRAVGRNSTVPSVGGAFLTTTSRMSLVWSTPDASVTVKSTPYVPLSENRCVFVVEATPAGSLNRQTVPCAVSA
jgi:hypothetical protein